MIALESVDCGTINQSRRVRRGPEIASQRLLRGTQGAERLETGRLRPAERPLRTWALRPSGPLRPTTGRRSAAATNPRWKAAHRCTFSKVRAGARPEHQARERGARHLFLGILGGVRAELVDYPASHRDELVSAFAATQRAIASRDLDSLTSQLAASAETQADALMASLQERR